MTSSLWSLFGNNQQTALDPITGLPVNSPLLTGDSASNYLDASGNYQVTDSLLNGTANQTMGSGLFDQAFTSSLADTGTPDAAPSFWGQESTWNNLSKGIGAVGALGNAYLGYKQLGQAEDQLNFQKEAFWANYNQQVADRELAAQRRAIANGTA